MRTCLGVMCGILLAALLLFVGCVVIVVGCTKAVMDVEADRAKARNATNQPSRLCFSITKRGERYARGSTNRRRMVSAVSLSLGAVVRAHLPHPARVVLYY
jgi:hypothetical protein